MFLELVDGDEVSLYVLHCTVEGGVESSPNPLPLPRGGVTNATLGGEGNGDGAVRAECGVLGRREGDEGPVQAGLHSPVSVNCTPRYCACITGWKSCSERPPESFCYPVDSV